MRPSPRARCHWRLSSVPVLSENVQGSLAPVASDATLPVHYRQAKTMVEYAHAFHHTGGHPRQCAFTPNRSSLMLHGARAVSGGSRSGWSPRPSARHSRVPLLQETDRTRYWTPARSPAASKMPSMRPSTGTGRPHDRQPWLEGRRPPAPARLLAEAFGTLVRVVARICADSDVPGVQCLHRQCAVAGWPTSATLQFHPADGPDGLAAARTPERCLPRAET